jgi:hypothetical protein
LRDARCCGNFDPRATELLHTLHGLLDEVHWCTTPVVPR